MASQTSNGIGNSYQYDNAARPTVTTVTLDGQSYSTTTQYDGNYGRPKALVYPNSLTIAYGYNSYGYLTTESNASSGYLYRSISDEDAFGNITQASLADDGSNDFYIRQNYDYNPVTGQLETANVTGKVLGSSGSIQALSYGYDSYGNLTEQSQTGNGINAAESYHYDALHRITQLIRNNTTTNYDYDASGNFVYKSDYSKQMSGAYQYVSNSNKIKQVTLTNNTTVSYGYDNKGNLTHRNNSQEAWYNVFNKPTRINRNGANVNFTYGADLARYKQVRTDSQGTVTTLYIGKLYELETRASTTRYNAYLGDYAIVSDIIGTSGNKRISYTLRDRLGSAVTFADHHGYTTARRHFDVFGKPFGGDWSDLEVLGGARLSNNPDDILMATQRGFTDHEHLDSAELIHMNGRVYDYNLGRFLSVDPFIQSPSNSQSINPYSYIMNNPLAGTDPTGYRTENIQVTGSRINHSAIQGIAIDGSITAGASNVSFSGSIKGTTVGQLKFTNGAAGGQGVKSDAATETVDKLGQEQRDKESSTNVGGDNYLVSRPLNSSHSIIDDNAAHMFVVAGAESMGDPDAEVFSYGELANGMTGNVGPGSSPSETSESTYKSDRAFWLGLAGKNNAERATQHTTRIRASSSRVASFARALREDTPYGLVSIFGLWQKELISTNSNAAALAVANRAASFGKASPVYMQLPDPSRMETNTVFWHHISFDGYDKSRQRILSGGSCPECRHE